MAEDIVVEVSGELILSQSDLDAAGGNLTQAAQDVLGGMGFIVLEVEER